MKFIQSFVIYSLVFAFVLFPAFVFAQSDPCNASISGKSNSELQNDLDACNLEIERLTEVLNSTKKNTATYATEVAKLTARINAAQATIKSKTLAISRLNSSISVKQNKITQLEEKIADNIKYIAELIRKTKEIDSFSVAEAILSQKDLSDFFVDVDTYESTRNSLHVLVDELRGNKTETESEKAELAKERDAESAAKAEIEANKRKVEVAQKEQKTLLTQSQNQEKAYSNLVAEKQAKANAIRTALFGLRDSVAIPFGTALQYAEEARQRTGVRPALVLAVLQQESNLGQNVGSCVVTDLTTGSSRSVKSGTIFSKGIHPTRDLPLLQTIVTDLGGAAGVTKVSCPLSVGYGGAMGPAQFIPSTWACFAGYINKNTGKCGPDYKSGPWYGPWQYDSSKNRIGSASLPDPWNAKDAITAMSIYLGDLGAGTGIYQNERTAACRYYSGKNCYTSNGRAGVGLSYGTSVMSRATTLQANIDLLQDA